ncbi:ABC transporter permease [Clostridium manihotivorum]|uniref:ABC transporter permease n=1 Tax=Clostridium manihotivorum TaxID=2320868 RepID=A0A3R5X1W4_9CLOT|nr:ABC transporter permease [Clostridium manihotivorum]QAA32385.1 ABC transporter permease [Clostridium manihotivorum]
MNILNIFKNNLYRTLSQKATIVMAFILIPLMTGMAVFFSEKTEIKGSIGYVCDNSVSIPRDPNINIEVLKEKPAFSSLLMGKYTAIVEKSGDNYNVTTLKSNKDKELIEGFFKTGKVSDANSNSDTVRKGIGTNILGYILMILLMQGIALINLYTEDRDKKTLRRILMSPANERVYLLTQGLFTFLSILIPSYLTLVITKLVFRVDINFSYGILFILVAIISALSTSLALLFASVLGTDYSLASTGIYVLTSLLAGCYVSLTGNNSVLSMLLGILPQKAYMTMIQGIENGKHIYQFSSQLLYLLVWIVGAYLLGSAVNRSKIKVGTY